MMALSEYMETIKEAKKQQVKEYIAKRKEVITRLENLITALNNYDKAVINKRFFELYFTSRYTKEWLVDDNNKEHKAGDIRKDWKGNAYTDFNFSSKQWEWEKYHKRIYLAHSEYLEVMDTNRANILKLACDKLEVVKGWLANDEKQLASVESVNEKQLIKELIAVYNKHGKPTIWSEILSSYEVKYPRD